jgi:hypothetical protein
VELYLAPVRLWLDQSAAVLGRMPGAAAIAILLLPLVPAAISRRLPTLFGALLLVIMAALLLAGPAPGATTIAIGTFLGSVIVATSGMTARRRDEALRAELRTLRSELNQVLAVQSRQFIVELNKARATPPAIREPRKAIGSEEPHGGSGNQPAGDATITARPDPEPGKTSS